MTPEETAQYQQLMKQMATPVKAPQRATAASPFQDFASGFGARQANDDATLTANNAAAEKPLDAAALKQQIIASHQSKGLGSDIMAGAQDLGTGILGGLKGLGEYANTAEGKNILAGMSGDVDVGQAYLDQAKETKGREIGQDSMAYEAEQNRKKALMDVLEKSKQNELEDTRLKNQQAFTAGQNTLGRTQQTNEFNAKQAQENLDKMFAKGEISGDQYSTLANMPLKEQNNYALQKRGFHIGGPKYDIAEANTGKIYTANNRK